MELLHHKTCVRFLPKQTNNVEHIEFRKDEGCGSSIGYRIHQSEPLIVTYSTFCLHLPGAIQHELLHVLGFLHEQSRPDRDKYVDIFWDNIDAKYKQNFYKIGTDIVDTFELPYDYKSLMHYPSNAFAKNGKNQTITAKMNASMPLGQSDVPTFYDLEKIRKMYKC